MQDRVTLPDRETRAAMMRQHVAAVAEAVLNDTTGDAVFESVLRLHRHVHGYSLRNTMLIHWQAPDSRLVASRTAFSRMAADTGHHPRARTSGKGRSWDEHVYVVKGSRAVWIWGRPRVMEVTRQRRDPETGEVTEEPHTYTSYPPSDVYRIEDIRCCDDDSPLTLPSFVQPIDDPDLFGPLLAFAGERGIEVTQEGLHGAAGVSRLGSIALQAGDSFALQVAPLLHELAHELLHGMRERLLLPREVVEAEAECVCGVLLDLWGHPVGLSASYLRHWCRGRQRAHEIVLDSMDRIAGAAAEIAGFVDLSMGSDVASTTGDAPDHQAAELAPPCVAVAS